MRLPPLAVIASWPAPNYIDPVTRGWANAIMNIILLPLVYLTIAIRVYTRLRISKSFGLDDWLILVSLIPATAFMVLSLVCEFLFDWNRHIWDVRFDNVVIGLKIIISTQILFTLGSALTKCSMLVLVYRVVQKTNGIFPRIVLAALVMVAMQSTLFIFMVIFQCRPISEYWTPSVKHQPECINETLHLLVAGIINTVSDFIAVLLPIPTVMKLKLPVQQQVAVVMLFAAGLLVTAAGAVRTYYTYLGTANFDATWNIYAVWLSSSVELYVGILCASLPATKMFFTLFAPKIFGSSFSSSKPTQKNTNNSSSSKSCSLPPSHPSEATEQDLEIGLVTVVPISPRTADIEMKEIIKMMENGNGSGAGVRRLSTETSISSFRVSGEEREVPRLNGKSRGFLTAERNGQEEGGYKVGREDGMGSNDELVRK